MKILVTGGAGFIGSHVSAALRARGDEVVVIDDFNGFLYPDWLKRERVTHVLNEGKDVTILEGNILDELFVANVFTEHTFDAVLHLAAYANPGRSITESKIYTDVNVRGTLNILSAMQEHGVKKLVFAGSSSVYNDEQTPFTEDAHLLRPRSPYGVSKAAAELYCSLWHDLYDMSVVVLRFFSVYGPWGRPDMAPMVFSERLLTGQSIELTRQKRQRDFTCIDDVVPAVLASLDVDAGFEVINVGRGEPVTLGDLITALEAASGMEAQIVERDAPPGEMRVTFANVDKARRLLGYAPKVSVGKGAAGLIEWMRDWYLPHVKEEV